VKQLSLRVDRRVLLVTVAVFIIMLGVGIVSPILPAYIESFGASHATAGLVIAGFGMARLLFDLPAGQWADVWGRKPLMVTGLLLSSGAGVLAALATDLTFLFGTRVVQGVGAAIFATAANAYVADIAPPTERGRYMGQFQAGFFLGTATGPALGGFLVDLGGIALPFWVLTALSLASAGFAWRFVPAYEAGARSTRFQRREIFEALARPFRSRVGLLVAFVSVVLFMMTAGIRLTGIPLLGAGFGFSAASIGAIISVIAAVNFIGTATLGGMSDRLGRRRTLIIGFVAAAGAIALFPLGSSLLTATLLAVGFGVGTSVLIPAQGALAVDLAHPAHRGVTLAAYRLFNDLGLTLGPILVGLLADLGGIGLGFVGMAIVCLGVALFAVVVEEARLHALT
jgi:MFS family permease